MAHVGQKLILAAVRFSRRLLHLLMHRYVYARHVAGELAPVSKSGIPLSSTSDTPHHVAEPVPHGKRQPRIKFAMERL